MHMCVRGIDFACFYGFTITLDRSNEFWSLQFKQLMYTRGLDAPGKNPQLYNTTRGETDLLAFLSSSEAYTNNWGLFAKENCLALDW